MPDTIAEENMELSEETQKEIEIAHKQIREGKFVTEEEMKKRLGLK